jgi:large subunit ribosomal protein L10
MVANTKIELRQVITSRALNCYAIFLVHFQGLKANTFNIIRKTIKENKMHLHVTKNTIAKLAFKDSNFSQLNEVLKKDSAIIFSHDDPINSCKILNNLMTENTNFVISHFAFCNNTSLWNTRDFAAFTKLPNKMDAISNLARVLISPLKSIYSSVILVPQSLLDTLQLLQQIK